MKKDCYTHPDHPHGHFRITSGTVVVTIIHGANSTQPGTKIFNVKRSDLRTCGCGRWRWANTKQQVQR